MVKLWIDDLRAPPDDSWRWAKTSTAAIATLMKGPVELISFDHDLGGKDTTIPVATYIEEECYYQRMKAPAYSIHSANPVGRKNLDVIMLNAWRYSSGPPRKQEAEMPWCARQTGTFLYYLNDLGPPFFWTIVAVAIAAFLIWGFG